MSRKVALVAALLGWGALGGQLVLTVNNSLVAGHGMAHGLVVYFGFFTITSNIFAALCFTAAATVAAAPFWRWWLVVPRGAVHWSDVKEIVVYPLAYLVYVFARAPLVGSYPYYFIDANALGLPRALLNSAGISLLFMVVLALMILVNHRGDRNLPLRPR